MIQDPVVLGALMRPTTSYRDFLNQKREEAFYIDQTRQLGAQEVAQKQLAEQQAAQFAAQVEALDFEVPDQIQVTGVVDRWRKDVSKRLATEFGGDRNKYLLYGQGRDIEALRSMMRTAPEVKQGLANKLAIAQAAKDAADGKISLGLNLSLPDPMNPGASKPTYVSFEDQLQAFRQGRIPSLTYRGSYASPKDFGKTFASQTKAGFEYGIPDPQNPSRMLPVKVSREEAYADWLRQGGTADGFVDLLNKNPAALDGLMWKTENYTEFANTVRHQKEQEENADQQVAISRGNLGVAQTNAETSRMNAGNSARNTTDLIRHRKVMEGISAQNAETSKNRAAASKPDGTPYSQIVFDPKQVVGKITIPGKGVGFEYPTQNLNELQLQNFQGHVIKGSGPKASVVFKRPEWVMTPDGKTVTLQEGTYTLARPPGNLVKFAAGPNETVPRIYQKYTITMGTDKGMLSDKPKLWNNRSSDGKTSPVPGGRPSVDGKSMEYDILVRVPVGKADFDLLNAKGRQTERYNPTTPAATPASSIWNDGLMQYDDDDN